MKSTLALPSLRFSRGSLSFRTRRWIAIVRRGFRGVEAAIGQSSLILIVLALLATVLFAVAQHQNQRSIVVTAILFNSLFHSACASRLVRSKSQCGISNLKFEIAPAVETGEIANLIFSFSLREVLKSKCARICFPAISGKFFVWSNFLQNPV